MASDILHIKDAYYFEVPKALWRSRRDSVDDFPEVWIRLDPEFQQQEAHQLAERLVEIHPDGGSLDHHDLLDQWEHWSHEHGNHGKPFDVFLEQQHAELRSHHQAWQAADPARQDKDFITYLNTVNPEFKWFAVPYESAEFRARWENAKEAAGGREAIAAFKSSHTWSSEKLDGYNAALSGKVLIPQPFGGTLRNLYEKESGFCVSKFMLIEVAIGLLMVLVFSWLARRMADSDRPRGRLWNFLEVFLLFIRDEIARPAIGGHHDDHEHDDHEHDDHHGHDDARGPGDAAGHGAPDGHAVARIEKGNGEKAHGERAHAGGHTAALVVDPADRFVPLLWTLFMFVLGCNLFGMLPWLGAPTGTFAVTSALAIITFGTGVLAGMKTFGPIGYFLNQIPGMDLPAPMAVVIKPMLFAIELLGLLIKHAVLAIRLLANMVAGHLVLLGVMGMAFGAKAALQFQGDNASYWWLTAPMAVGGSALFSCLELLVAFLQAYIFTLLSALFIGAAVHKH